MGIGEKLKNERLKQGISLQEVEKDTKIRKYYLDAIENENYSVLPPKVYAVGFVKRYAKFLDLDVEEYAELFKQAAYGTEPNEIIKEPPKKIRPQGIESSITWKNVLVALVFLITVIWLGDYLITYFTKDHNISPNKGQQPIVEQHKEVDEKSDKEITPPKQQTGVEIVIEANQNCWLNVVVDNDSQYNAILNAGENLTFNGADKIYLKAGNAGGIKIIYNGEEMPPLGNNGEVKEATYTPF